MADPFESAWRKVARANEHFDDLEQEIGAFIKGDPYEQVVEADPEISDQLLHKFKLVKQIPSFIAETVGDIVTNLRAALDHATYIVAASRCTTPKYAHFPFSGTADRFEAALKGNAKDLPVEIYPLFRTFQPYKGGNDLLYALNAVANADKHAMLTPIGTAFLRPYTSVKGTGYLSMTLPEHSAWDRTKQEIVFLKAHTDTELDYKVNFVFFIAFNKIDAVDGEPVIPVLYNFGCEVERVLLAIETESRRLGFS